MRALSPLASLAVALLLLTGCTTGDDAVVAGSEFQLVAPNGETKLRYDGDERKSVKGLAGPSLMEDGKTVSLDDYAGKVVIVNIWGAWCGPCRTEAPELQKVQDETGPLGVQVLGVDVKESSTESPRDFMANRKLSYPSIYDESGRAMLAFRGVPPNAVPSTFVLDKQHRVAAAFLGAVIASDLVPLVKDLAAES
ncbi:alkyl hydroperoxide reductase [Saccharothrix sp. NRRL B-16348]|uniref:TlpA disulfide reductase family protein n=1 Tax=Saccharothrix sp. NRRL B-16348 TaxID=1415542 RepID=UPI0006AFD65A|nr:TlpA disulfide reductase family protein [Saccharothrix sp. NRRL B-16348]KOX33828.1 alkyl hydroperoxide reductase [Saccharothrix sp. NRRL B-16348]